jgi:spermidine synthase
MAAQLVCLREVMSTFGGNELVVGVALGIWLFATGVGSRLGAVAAPRLPPRGGLFAGHLLIALLPLAMLGAVRAIPSLSGVRGEMLGPRSALLGCLAVFLPFGLVSGGMIPLAGRLLGENRGTARGQGTGAVVRQAYVLDSAGSAFGGLVFSLLLVQAFSHGASLALFGWINVVAAGLLATRCAAVADEPAEALDPFPAMSRRRTPGWGARAVLATTGAALLVSAVALAFARPLDRATAGWRFPGQTVILRRETPFAQITVTRSGRQENVYQDAIPLYSSGDLAAETRVHPALCQVPVGSEVLLVGGGVFGGLREAARHAPATIDYVEPDRAIFALAPDSLPEPFTGDENNRRISQASSAILRGQVRLHAGDGRAFVQSHRSAFDAILLDLPGPENAGLNRYYTAEFFLRAARALKPGGVFSFSLAASPNYLGEEQLSMERSIHAALRRAFTHVEVLPGEMHVYLAANRPLTLDVPDILASRGITTERLLDYDWPELSDPFRREELAALLSDSAGGPNRDLAPTAFGHLIHREARKSGSGDRLFWILAGVSALALLLATGFRATGVALGTTGFAAIALELEVFLLFQVLFGDLYLRLALFATLFLVGAAGGALLSPRLRIPPRGQMAAADGWIVFLALLLSLYAWRAPSWAAGAPWAHQIVLCLFILLVAAATGGQFAAAGEADSERIRAGRAPGEPARAEPAIRPTPIASAPSSIGRLYLADLAGAACGTVLTGLILLPRAGIAGATVAVVAIKAASLLFSVFSDRAT